MKRVTPHVGLLTGIKIANVWLLESADGRWLIDTGHPVERATLRVALWRAGVRRKGDLAGVLLTHRHSDHAGNAAWLRRTFDCPVVCHEADAPYLCGHHRPPPMSGRGMPLHHELLCRVEDRFPSRCHVDETFADGPWRKDFRIIEAPGHTEGSVMLYHTPTRSLFSGDVLLAGLPVQRLWTWPRLARPEYTLDLDGCRRHVLDFLRALPATSAWCAGHGPPVTRRVRSRLQRLLERQETR